MRLRRHILTVLPLLVVFAACGDSPSDPPKTRRPAAVSIDGPAEVVAGDTATYVAEVRDQNGALIAGASVGWSSGNQEVATVTSAGLVTAVAAGTVRLTASAGGVNGHMDVAVTPLYVGALALFADSVHLTTLNESYRVRGSVNGDTVEVTLSVASEIRWNPGRPVAVPSGDQVTAVGAGRIIFEAWAEGVAAAPDTLLVVVAPEGAYVVGFELPAGAVGQDNRILAHGFGLNGAEFVSGTDTADVAVVDSATVSLGLPEVSACLAGPFYLDVTGAQVLSSPVEFARARDYDSPLNVAVGEAALLSSEDVACLQLAAGEYSLAFYDQRWVNGHGDYDASDSISVAVGDLGVSQVAAGFAGKRFTTQVATKAYAFAKSTTATTTDPWEVGDTVVYPNLGPSERAVIKRLSSGFAIAVPLDDGDLVTDIALDTVASMVAAHDSLARPWLERDFGVSAFGPNDQYLLIIAPRESDLFRNRRSNNRVFVSEVSGYERGGSSLYAPLMHEIGHEYMVQYHDSIIASEMSAVISDQFTWEGIADFISARAVVERYGVPVGQNVPWEQFRSVIAASYRDKSNLRFGYGPAAAFMWDLTNRVAAASGMSWFDAYSEVLRGIKNDRRGCLYSGDCARYEGLYDVMERHVGADWDPVEAVLTHTLTQAIDDLTDSPTFQDPHIYRMRDVWGPADQIAAGETATTEIRLAAGGTHYVDINVSDHAAFKLSSEIGDDVRWMIARYK